MKKISLEQLLRESGEETYWEQYRYICRRIEAQELVPVKKSPLNGKKPALHLSYWLAEGVPDYTEEMEELKFRMAPEIRTDYYLKHPGVYREEAEWVRLLNRYFLEQGQKRAGDFGESVYVSLNERSFQIWGREKFLQREQGRKILAHCGVELQQLYVYGTTEPLAYYSRSRRVPQTILILENKDTFYSMRRYLSGEWQRSGLKRECRKQDISKKCSEAENERIREEGRQNDVNASAGVPGRIFGIEIGTVIYGAGKGILRSFEDFRLCVESHVNAPENEILYFGDLDYEGIGIYERLADLFGAGQDGCEIKPFIQAYEKMLEKAKLRGLDFLPVSSENQNQKLSGLFFSCFPDDTKGRMKQILASGKYIPQEIINITDF